MAATPPPGKRGSQSTGSDPREPDPQVQRELLWNFYVDLRTHARHAETLRATGTNYVLVIAAASVGAIALDDRFTYSDWPFCLLLSAVGFFGSVFSVSYLERSTRNRKRAEVVRQKLDDLFLAGQATTTSLQSLADDELARKRPYRLLRLPLFSTHVYWLGLPLLVFVVGAVASVLALASGGAG